MPGWSRWRVWVVVLMGLCLVAPVRCASEAQASTPRPRGRAACGADTPPPCPITFAKPAPPNRQPPPRSMPEMFSRMADSFARNPATGFQNWLNELSSLEGPALEGVTLSAAEERQAGKQGATSICGRPRPGAIWSSRTRTSCGTCASSSRASPGT